MTIPLSPNTKAILLLTAPLIAADGVRSSELLSPGEYKRLARHLHDLQREPADLLSSDVVDLLRDCQHVLDETRIQRLLARGFLFSQAIERWQTRAISVISRADPEYPRRLRVRLRGDGPAILYVCGNVSLLESGGLAVVGSRDADDSLIEYTMDVGRLAARAGKTIVSGGAKGIDRAAMRGALEAGGRVSGVLSDGLEKASMHRENRSFLIDDQLVLISPYDPAAGFNVGNAMRRNRLIYALADASLIVSSDVNKGGTWSGAVEQLDKLRLVPVYVRSTEGSTNGLDALRKKGALPWPNPRDSSAFNAIFDVADSTLSGMESGALSLFPEDASAGRVTPETSHHKPATVKEVARTREPGNVIEGTRRTTFDDNVLPSDVLFRAVLEAIRRLLKAPMKESDVASALGVTAPQAKIWLQRLVGEGELEKLKKPVRYVVKQ